MSKRVALAILAMAITAGCSSDAPPLPCPPIVVVRDADQMTRFEGAGRDLTDVIFQADLTGTGVTCSYDEAAIDVEMLVRIQARRGPADLTNRADLSYFVAISGREQNVIAREEFDVAVRLPSNGAKVSKVDEVKPRIPLAPGQNGADFRIYVGLQLSPEELEYNRAEP